jgi:hypothetical protein
LKYFLRYYFGAQSLNNLRGTSELRRDRIIRYCATLERLFPYGYPSSNLGRGVLIFCVIEKMNGVCFLILVSEICQIPLTEPKAKAMGLFPSEIAQR